MAKAHLTPFSSFITLLSPLSSSSRCCCREEMAFQYNHAATTRIESAVKSPPLLSAINAGLRAPSDRFALKSAFFAPSLHLLLASNQHLLLPSPSPKFSMRVASKQAYICRDCGYIYNERTPFEIQPDKYFCPVCGAPKRRFRPYAPAVNKNANETATRKERKAQIQRDEAIGRALPIGIVVGVAALVGLYFYLNTNFQG